MWNRLDIASHNAYMNSYLLPAALFEALGRWIVPVGQTAECSGNFV